MKLLLDTSPFLWYISDDERLPERVKGLIRSADHRVWLSAVSFWEIAVKQLIGKLPLPEPAWAYIPRERERHGIDSLALAEAAIVHLTKLPSLHRDPFDRMLICQAIEYDLLLVTGDPMVIRYPVKTVW